MQKIEVTENDEHLLKEIYRKSTLSAEDTFDYMKLTMKVQGLVPCTFEETLEEVMFVYDVKELSPISHMKQEPEERKLQFLINFAKLYSIFTQYAVILNEKNLYYDENLMPLVKSRDIYGREHEAVDSEFLYSYKCIVGGILNKKYSVTQVLDSGLEILAKDKTVQEIITVKDVETLVQILKEKKDVYLKKKSEEIREVSRRRYLVWRAMAIVMLMIGLISGGMAIYYGAIRIPIEESLVKANERFITKDYVGCIDSIKAIEVENMDIHTKYILAVSYASTESFKKEEISNIVSKLSINTNEKELEYWICLGRLDVRQAQNLALTLSDDKLLIYAYMKEIDILENDTNMDGEEKKARLDTLNNEIQALGKKYSVEEQ